MRAAPAFMPSFVLLPIRSCSPAGHVARLLLRLKTARPALSPPARSMVLATASDLVLFFAFLSVVFVGFALAIIVAQGVLADEEQVGAEGGIFPVVSCLHVVLIARLYTTRVSPASHVAPAGLYQAVHHVVRRL